MRLIFAMVVIFISNVVSASETPLSGTFSNVKNAATHGFKPPLKHKMNLMVIQNENGHQIILQCFTGDEPGFAVITEIEADQVQRIAKVNAGPECWSQDLQVELDYESAVVRGKGGWVYLPRGEIHIPTW